VQQQLTAYLGALLNIEEAKEKFNAKEMIPAGCFLIPLRPTKSSARSRSEALSRNEKEARARAYTHSGLFDLDLIDRLDSKNKEEKSGQFSYRITNGKLPHKGSFSALTPQGFKDVVINAETILKEAGENIFSGKIAIHPYRSGNRTACDQCDLGPVCRFDPWTQKYNILQKLDK
jgi:ATP-dependent helicase/nuclease subunit B